MPNSTDYRDWCCPNCGFQATITVDNSRRIFPNPPTHCKYCNTYWDSQDELVEPSPKLDEALGMVRLQRMIDRISEGNLEGEGK